MSNHLYEAILEGRAPVKAQVQENEDGSFKATVKQWGIEAEAVAQSSRHAQNQAVGKFLDDVRKGKQKISRF